MSLHEIYIGCTVFAVSVTALDFLGVLGGHEDGDGGDGTVGEHGDVDAGHADGGEMADSGADAAEDVDTAHADHSGTAVLSVLSYLRSIVYFCLGFGPTGWVATATGRGMLVSLAWAVPAGVAAFLLARLFFRFQRSDTDSSLRVEDLLFQRATVLIPMDHEKMGKVRVHVGMNVTEQYALAAKPDAHFNKGETVRIANVTDECVYVEDELDGEE